MSQVYPLIIANRYESRQDTMTVFHKYTGEPFAQMSAASVEDVDTAVVQAKHALEHTYFDVQTRYQVLMKAADLLKERREELAAILTAEAGKTVQDAHNEVDWSVDLFVESAEEAKRLNGETFCMPVPWLDTRTCYTRREPVGVVVAITPFNFPLNLVAHKVAPALAAGNPVILKPAAATSVIGWKLCEILIDAGLPAGFISCLTGSGSVLGPALAAHPGVSFYSFTGSVDVGQQLKAQIGLRKCAMELGSNSATIVCDDFELDQAVNACADAAFCNAGQVCIHLQRIFVARSIFEPFVAGLTKAAQEKVVGDPSDPATEIGPMIAQREAARVEEWVAQAVADGAVVHCGNRREGALFWPTVLTQVTGEMRVMKDEIFGPVVCVVPFDTMEEAYAMVNDSRYGLNGGILTHSLPVAMQAIQSIHCGSVIVGGTCGFRFGCMPYGGVKESGFGKEGPHYAVEEMTEQKTVVIL